MIGLWILGILILLFLLLLFLRVGADISFGEQLQVQVRIGPFRLQILPKKEGSSKPKKKKDKPKKEKAEEQGEKQEKTKKGLGLTFADIREAFPILFDALKAALRQTRRRLLIRPMQVAVTFGGADPADAAQMFGWANAAVWSAMPQLEKLVRMPEPYIHLDGDYTGGPTRAEGKIGLSFQVRDLLIIAFSFGIPVLKWFLAFKKKQKAGETRRKTDENHKAKTEQTKENQNKHDIDGKDEHHGNESEK